MPVFSDSADLVTPLSEIRVFDNASTMAAADAAIIGNHAQANDMTMNVVPSAAASCPQQRLHLQKRLEEASRSWFDTSDDEWPDGWLDLGSTDDDLDLGNWVDVPSDAED